VGGARARDARCVYIDAPASLREADRGRLRHPGSRLEVQLPAGAATIRRGRPGRLGCRG
jgi:hypothetical protein